VNAVCLGDQIEQRQIVNCDNLIRGPIVPEELAGFWMCHNCCFRRSEKTAGNYSFRQQRAWHPIHEPWLGFLQSCHIHRLNSGGALAGGALSASEQVEFRFTNLIGR
jgi:hypothetical protein